MKKLSKIFLCLLLILSVGVLSACTSYSDGPDTDEKGESYIGNIEGFKATYRPESFQFVDYYQNLAKNILTELVETFYLANEENISDDFAERKYQEYLNSLQEGENKLSFESYFNEIHIYFVDDIKSSVYLADVNSEGKRSYQANQQYRWSWYLGLSDGFLNYSPTSTETGYAKGYWEMTSGYFSEASPVLSWSFQPDIYQARQEFANYFIEKFTPALQVVILENLLGKTPTVFEVAPSKPHEITPNPTTLLPSLKQEFQLNATYVGIKPEDKTAITNYVLEKIIGSNKYNNSYFTKNDYQSIINNLWETKLANLKLFNESENKELEQSLYDTYPTNLIKDYAGNSFFLSSQTGKQFAHIERANYQSLVFMPTQVNYIYEIWLYLASDRIFDVRVYYRYYDYNTNTYFESTPKIVSTYIEQTFDETNPNNKGVTTFNFYKDGKETLYVTSPFDANIGNGVLKASTPKTFTPEVFEFYELKPSLNGFGSVAVLNTQKFRDLGQSYFEFVFDVVKTDPLADYNFKPALSAIWFANDYMIYNYQNGLPLFG